MIIPGREMEGADLKGHFGLATWPPSLPSPSFPGILGEQCPLQKVRSHPGLGSHQSASGHTEALSSPARSRTLHHCASRPCLRPQCLQHVLGGYFYCVQLTLLAG